jgi:hypothetical protein
LKSSRFENALKNYSNLSQFDFNSNSVQKYFKPLIFESKIMFKIQKKGKSLCFSLLSFQPISSLGPFSSLLHSQ